MNSNNNKKELIFFTLNTFQNEGGGTIRMYGIVNELAKQGNAIILISNAVYLDKFHEGITHIQLGYPFSRQEKRQFQAIVGIFPYFLSVRIYYKLFNQVYKVFKENGLIGKSIYFFEYLDNTVGYLIKLMKWISEYFNDIHGIPTLEFKFRAANAISFTQRLELYLKYLVATLVDRKVYGGADGYIFSTLAMKSFFEKMYPRIKVAKNLCLPYLVSDEISAAEVDNKLLQDIRKNFDLQPANFVLLFAGGFKKTGGMTDLIHAVDFLLNKYPQVRLLLIGDGPVLKECQDLGVKKKRDLEIKFVGRTSYNQLRTFQEAADLLVCPDKQNIYSQLIIHVKYFDALASGKLVINGSFPSVVEVNPNDELSVSFEPSNILDLAKKIEYCMKNAQELRLKYKNNPAYTKENFTYSAYLKKHRLDWF